MGFLEMMHADTLRTAAGLLARRGYENVQAAALAEALRMSVGTLYRHYGSKLGLALAVRDFTEKELSYQADVAFMLTHGKPGVDFAQAFSTFWWELVWWALTKPDLFHFTFLHWHAQEYGPRTPPAPGPRVAGALVPTQSYGGATRALVRQVLEQGEREGALAHGCVKLGEGLVWGTLLELARAAWQGEPVGETEVRASAHALWRALAREEDARPRGNGTPSPGGDSGPRGSGTPSPGEDSGPRSSGTSSPDEASDLRCAGTPFRGGDVPSPRTPGSLAATASPEVKQSPVADSRPAGGAHRPLLRHRPYRQRVPLPRLAPPCLPQQTRLSSGRASQRKAEPLTWRPPRGRPESAGQKGRTLSLSRSPFG